MAATLPILTFHALDDRRSAISFSPDRFRRGMARLHEGGYRAISLVAAVDCLRRGMPFPDRSFVITFDDGYRAVYTEGLPVLQRYGLEATVFLTVGENGSAGPADRLPSLNGRSMLAWREVQEMQRSGISFGAHTLTHPDLTRLRLDRAEAEVRDSKAIIEDVLGAPVASFAYPCGRHDQRTRGIVRQHFVCACSDRLGLVAAGSDPYALERVDAHYLRTERLFGMMSTRRFSWYVWGRNIPRSIRRAVWPSSG